MLSKARNSYERAKIHQKCEDEFDGEGKPSTIERQQKVEIERVDRGLITLKKRADEIVERASREIETPVPLNDTSEEVRDLWLKYTEYSNKLTKALGRTNNVVGEYAMHLAKQHYDGRLTGASEAGANLISPDGTGYEVKSRRVQGSLTTSLSVIRSWDFDVLVVILFDIDGAVTQALEVPVYVAKEHAAENPHQNGRVIRTTQKFLNDSRCKDITKPLAVLNS